MCPCLFLGTGRSGSTFDIFREDLSTDSDGNNPVENDFIEVYNLTVDVVFYHDTCIIVCSRGSTRK